MTTPTPEQKEAAKAWRRGEATPEQWRILSEFSPGSAWDNGCDILFAALETAEAERDRLVPVNADDIEAIQKVGGCLVVQGDAIYFPTRGAMDPHTYYRERMAMHMVAVTVRAEREQLESARKAQP
jgi:hypothetical protein